MIRPELETVEAAVAQLSNAEQLSLFSSLSAHLSKSPMEETTMTPVALSGTFAAEEVQFAPTFDTPKLVANWQQRAAQAEASERWHDWFIRMLLIALLAVSIFAIFCLWIAARNDIANAELSQSVNYYARYR